MQLSGACLHRTFLQAVEAPQHCCNAQSSLPWDTWQVHSSCVFGIKFLCVLSHQQCEVAQAVRCTVSDLLHTGRRPLQRWGCNDLALWAQPSYTLQHQCSRASAPEDKAKKSLWRLAMKMGGALGLRHGCRCLRTCHLTHAEDEGLNPSL